MKIFESFSAEDTKKIAFKFGENAKQGDIFCLSGTLGAGKTVFVQGFAKGIGYNGRVTSPTFTIMNEYENENGRLPVYHFDLYRLEADDLESIGYEEYFFGNGVCLVEWSERAENLFQNAYYISINSNNLNNESFREIIVRESHENFSD